MLGKSSPLKLLPELKQKRGKKGRILKQKLRNRVAAEKKEERLKIEAQKATALAAKKLAQAARRLVTVQRKALPKGPNSQQGAVLTRARTLDDYLGARKNPLSKSSNGSESVSSPPLSEEDGGVPKLAPVRRGKVQPTRKGAQKGEGYYVEQATIDNSDVDEPRPAFTDVNDFSINDCHF